MFAQLGDIKFELITYFNGLNENVSYNYAQHDRIENKPILQFLGKNLIEEDIKLNFHRSFCVPEDELKNLIDAADKATPLKFIKGNGEYIGAFIIQEIGKLLEQATPDGGLISIQVGLKLREYTGKIPEDEEEDKGFKKR
ncbi:MAG: phage tail protein [Candidatus Gastranaerophilales bacterium]|nr:phage tail protein [Candidatus Gastranaerophilales bacterium]